jgi:glycosyltransferase involved in cell wall biosynthesis
MVTKNKSISIAYVGNIVNNFYRELKFLQKIANVNVHLFIIKNISTPNTELPESDEPILKSGYPDWIQIYEGPVFGRFDNLLRLFGITWLFKSRNKKILQKLGNYDLCVMSGPDAVLLPFISGLKVFRATGSDLTVFPLFSFKEFKALRPYQEPKNLLKKFFGRMEYYGKRMFYRRAITKADYVDGGFGEPFENAIKQLKIPSKKLLPNSRLCIDLDVFKKSEDSFDYCETTWNIPKDSFVISIPSRMMIKAEYVHRKTGQWKASDVALKGIRRFLEQLDGAKKTKIVIAIPDRTLSDDLVLAKNLIKDLDLENNVKFVRGEEDQGLRRFELIKLYSRSSAVLDDFGAGWYGSVVVEALACGAPVITHVPTDLMARMFPWHPILLAKTESEIAEKLALIYRSNTEQSDIFNRGREWVETFHSKNSVIDNFVHTICKIVKRKTD